MTTIILNHQPYDGTDVTWNALRLAKTLFKSGENSLKGYVWLVWISEDNHLVKAATFLFR